MENRVVVTGLGAVSPNAVNLAAFRNALISSTSGIRRYDFLESMNFRCHLGAMPALDDKAVAAFCDQYNLVKLRSTGILYGCMAGIEAWLDAKLPISSQQDEPDWNSGSIFGTSGNGMEAIEYGMKLIDRGDVRKLGGRLAQQAMNSGVSAYLGGILGLGNQVTTNASGCATGTESVLDAYMRIKWGLAERMLVGSSESSSKYIWGGYDRMPGCVSGFALTDEFNHCPEKASRPMSRNARGFVPGAGAGAMVLESLDSALNRKAKIYAEILGGASNSGGQRENGTMLSNNQYAVRQVIEKALYYSRVNPGEIDLISGHLPSNESDVLEVESWTKALKRDKERFPSINALKSMTGHCLSASGSLELVASILQLHGGFMHASLNSSDLHPGISALISSQCVPQKTVFGSKAQMLAKLSCGIGDVNSCVVLRRWDR